MKIFHAAAKLDAGADKKHDINFHCPKLNILYDPFWPSTPRLESLYCARDFSLAHFRPLAVCMCTFLKDWCGYAQTAQQFGINCTCSDAGCSHTLMQHNQRKILTL